VGDRDDGLAARLQLGQELPVEDLAKGRILIGGPLVEDVDGPVLEHGGEQGEALLLAP
jgi:hypothetical protein